MDLFGHSKSSYIDGQISVVHNIVQMVWKRHKCSLRAEAKVLLFEQSIGISEAMFLMLNWLQ